MSERQELLERLYSAVGVWLIEHARAPHNYDETRAADSREAVARAFFAVTDDRYRTPTTEEVTATRPTR